jgi:hypothetical protein
LRRVAVEVIAAGNANVGHLQPPEFGCPEVKVRCTLQAHWAGEIEGDSLRKRPTRVSKG